MQVITIRVRGVTTDQKQNHLVFSSALFFSLLLNEQTIFSTTTTKGDFFLACLHLPTSNPPLQTFHEQGKLCSFFSSFYNISRTFLFSEQNNRFSVLTARNFFLSFFKPAPFDIPPKCISKIIRYNFFTCLLLLGGLVGSIYQLSCGCFCRLICIEKKD